MKTLVTLLSLSFVLSACGNEPANESASEFASEATAEISIYAAAVANSARLEADYGRDAGRKPDQVLAFFGVEPGMTVLDMFAGGGYYTELVSYVVGENGRVVAHTNEPYLGFVGKEHDLRHADGRLPNVEILMAENNELKLNEAEFDAILLVMAYHDTYHSDPENGWHRIDVPTFLAELYKGLKPDGFIGIIDHYADAGLSRQDGAEIHRIDPAIVIKDMQAAGFTLEEQSDILRNSDDEHSTNVFKPEVYGKTDRFTMRFRKKD
jgi:predicted methyltransferase